MNETTFFKVRIYFTGVITFIIWTLLAWSHCHGGVPSHHILANKDLPELSNWWGGLLLPLLTWFLLYRIQKRITGYKEKNPATSLYYKDTLYRFVGSLFFGILLSVFFTFGFSDMSGNLVLGLFPLALFFPIYRAECLLGLITGMTFTFGTVLPTGIGSMFLIVSAILYLFIRPGIKYVAMMFLHMVSSNKT